MEDAKNPDLLALLSDLNGLAKDGSHVAVLKCCDKILTDFPRDRDVLVFKARALLQLNRMHDLLLFIDRWTRVVGEEVKSWLAYERAYCLYRLGRHEEAIFACELPAAEAFTESAESSWTIQRRLILVRSQAMYRLGRFSECAGLCAELLHHPLEGEAEKPDVASNCVGALANSIVESEGLESEAAAKEAFVIFKEGDSGVLAEIVYNAACVAVSKKDWRNAASFLERAERMLKEAEDMGRITEEDFLVDVAPIRAQLGFVRQKTGDAEGALALFADLKRDVPEKPSVSKDAAVDAVVSNNLVSLIFREDPRVARQLLKKAADGRASSRLLKYQRDAIRENLETLNASMGPRTGRDDSIPQIGALRISSEWKIGSSPGTGDSGASKAVASLVARTKPKKLKKKVIRLPKDYDPLIPPDPERWLPKHQRTGFKKRKGRVAKGGASQGAMPALASTVPSTKTEGKTAELVPEVKKQTQTQSKKKSVAQKKRKKR